MNANATRAGHSTKAVAYAELGMRGSREQLACGRGIVSPPRPAAGGPTRGRREPAREPYEMPTPTTSGLVSSTFLALLTDSEREALRGLGMRRTFPRGAVLMFEGEPDERVMLVFNGRVKVTALEPVEVLVMPAQVFRTHLETTPRVAVVLLEIVASRFREATIERLRFAASDTMGRLAARITELADRYGEPGEAGIVIASPISQEELASWTGASRAGVAQALQALRELG